MNEPKYTVNELNKAMGSLLIVLGAHLPENLVESMSSMLIGLYPKRLQRAANPALPN